MAALAIRSPRLGALMARSPQAAETVGRTRWRRFGLAAGAGVGAVALIGYLGATGAFGPAPRAQAQAPAVRAR